MRTDIENALKKYKGNTVLYKPSFKAVEKKLTENEEVLFISGCNCTINPLEKLKVNTFSIKGKKPYAFTVTSKRIILCYSRFLQESTKIIDLDKIQAYNLNKSLTGCKLRITGITEQFDIDIPPKKETYAFLNDFFSNLPSKSEKKNDDANNSVGIKDEYEEIKKAKELLDMGIITQEEFDTKKKQLLDL